MLFICLSNELTARHSNVWPLLMCSHAFGTRISLPNVHIPAWNFQELSDVVQLNMAQGLQFHAGMCTFGSEILVPKACEHIKSGHTFGRRALKNNLINPHRWEKCASSIRIFISGASISICYYLTQGIELNDLDNEFRTPLLLAASRGCTGAVEILLEHGADSSCRDAKNRTVIHSAVGHSDTLAVLLKVSLLPWLFCYCFYINSFNYTNNFLLRHYFDILDDPLV
jgi:hypothetical protein